MPYIGLRASETYILKSVSLSNPPVDMKDSWKSLNNADCKFSK